MYGDLVSVIIPTYNRRYTIKRALDSVRAQTYTNLEVIIVDDGSTDDTLSYIQKWYGDADWLTYIINDENQGAAASRNTGVRYAKGNYIAFHDSDDEWLPEKLAQQMQLIDLGIDVGMVYCCMERRIGEEIYDVWPPKESPLEVKSGNMYRTLLLGPVIGTHTMLCKKQAFLSLGGFDTQCGIMEDYEFSLRFSKHYKILLADETLAIQYQSAKGLNSNLDERFIMHVCMMEQYYEDLKQMSLLQAKLSNVYDEAYHCNKISEYLSCLLCSEHARYRQFAKQKIEELKE